MRVIWASHGGFAGCLTSARNAAGVLGGETLAIDDGGTPLPPDADLVVLSSWHDAYEPLLGGGSRVVGRWHSTLLQTELSGDLWKLERLLDLLGDTNLGALVCADRETAVALGVPWLPDVLDEREYAAVRPAPLEGVAVVLPGEPYPRKNVLVQAAAFEHARAGRDWTLHLLGQTLRRPELAAWLRRRGVPFADHGFLERGEYLALVAGASAGLAASLTESWGYAAGDFVALGVPVVVSPAVTSVDDADLVAEPESIASVAGALERALRGGRPLADRAAEAMRTRAAANADVARAALDDLVEHLGETAGERRP